MLKVFLPQKWEIDVNSMEITEKSQWQYFTLGWPIAPKYVETGISTHKNVTSLCLYEFLNSIFSVHCQVTVNCLDMLLL